MAGIPPFPDVLRLSRWITENEPINEPAPVGPGRVLIIDDDQDVREMFQETLELAGFNVITAANGAEGLARLGSDLRVCVVLLDLLMPEMDGWRFRHHQLSNPKLAAIPTVIVTGAAIVGIADDHLKAADYLSKPVSREQLLTVVAKYCRRTDSPGSAA